MSLEDVLQSIIFDQGVQPIVKGKILESYWVLLCFEGIQSADEDGPDVIASARCFWLRVDLTWRKARGAAMAMYVSIQAISNLLSCL